MTRNRGRATRERDALKQLMHRLPEGDSIFATLFTLSHVKAADDRTVAIVGAAAIEHALKSAIRQHLKPDLTSDEETSFFEVYPSGLLTSFSARIQMAVALGIIDGLYEADMQRVRRIRNVFAHSALAIDFQTDEIVTECQKFEMYNIKLLPGWRQIVPAREHYAGVCTSLYAILMFYERGRPARETWIDRLNELAPPNPNNAHRSDEIL